MRGIRVVFGALVANDAVDLSVEAGEIHALLGENGAGKSTLMRVLAGLIMPENGEIRIDGALEPLGSAREAMRLGIGMVHQHFMLVRTLTVAENVCLGLAKTGRFFPDLKAASARIRKLSADYGLDVDPDARVADLSVAGQQRVEILKTLFRGARILVLDEPTAVLTPQESVGLFRVLQSLAAEGAAIIFISHKLNEVMALTSKVTVLRHGKVVATTATSNTDVRSLARLMVGADMELPTQEDRVSVSSPLAEGEIALQGRAGACATSGEGTRPASILSITGVTCRDARGSVRVERVSLSVGVGEIVGIAGVDGNGQQELAEAIVGLRGLDAGRIELVGEDVTRATVARRIALGLAHIPEDRRRTALVEPMSIEDNLVLEEIETPRFSREGWINRHATAAFASRILLEFDVRAYGPQQRVGTLSGGNQQKIVLGRALSREPKLVVAVQPARGLDVGATAFVHRQLLALRAADAAVLLISTELDEIRALSDRVIVMFQGSIAGELSRSEITIEKLGLLMAGRTT
jgi:general nucleoside transport system ATP-binding protein